jgi:predicted TIM-barrel fold metal-dependent hydrolase
VGVDRILFGTGMPVYTGAGAVFYIKKLMLGEEDKQKIASVNLTRLLNGVKL